MHWERTVSSFLVKVATVVVKSLLPELLSLETCRGFFCFPMGLLSVKLVAMQNDRIITVKISSFEMESDYIVNHLDRE